MSVRHAALARGAKVWSYRRARIRPARRSSPTCGQAATIRETERDHCVRRKRESPLTGGFRERQSARARGRKTVARDLQQATDARSHESPSARQLSTCLWFTADEFAVLRTAPYVSSASAEKAAESPV